MKKIIEDLEARDLAVVAFICEDVDGDFQVLGYDTKGLLNFITQKVSGMIINEKLSGRVVRTIAEINLVSS